jgi:hypothetical protein
MRLAILAFCASLRDCGRHVGYGLLLPALFFFFTTGEPDGKHFD